MSLTKRVQTIFRRLPHLAPKKKAQTYTNADWKALEAIWPDGTWTMPYLSSTTNAQMDDVTRITLFDIWTVEDRLASEKTLGMKLDPAKFYANPVSADWKPSERVFRQHTADHTMNTKFVNYVVGRLVGLERLAS